ncbi:hypothetical protein B7P43_G01634 [Cryptotermes secundus]|uniref:Mos1 transposase HTH domain-containing protein n=1 Tax=Cryptotermes secundus TaxID=105785 RepID=A0A2J7QM00_9NEOP|nr:hypothetical protein B7P43_G01634 [Cryptotermes secundus]
MACRLQHSADARTPSQHQYKMAAPLETAPLETCTREEQHSVIRFLCSEGMKPIEIYRRVKFQYGDACLSQQQVYEWSRKFANGVTSVEDAPRLGQAHRVVTPENTAAVEAIVRENRRVTLNEIAASLNISHGSARHIVHDMLQFHKVSARWVPRQLTPELKDRRIDACEELPWRFEREGVDFLARIVTGDETWVHFHQLETKPHTAHTTVVTINDLHFECVPHLAYSPDLAPNDFPMFGPLKEAMGGKMFLSDEEVCHVVHEWLRGLPKEFFSKGIHALCTPPYGSASCLSVCSKSCDTNPLKTREERKLVEGKQFFHC